MKHKEMKILDVVNNDLNDPMVECFDEYSRFDAYNKYYIAEIKFRNKVYDDMMIEFDKYSFNKEYAKVNDKIFIYVVGVGDKTYVFNITDLDKNQYDFKWSWREMPKNTEFGGDQNKIKKFVGYINVSMATIIKGV